MLILLTRPTLPLPYLWPHALWLKLIQNKTTGVHMSHIQLGWSFCRGKVSCVIDWQRPKKRAVGRKPKLKEEIRCCRQCVGAQLVPFDSPPLYSEFYKKILSENKMYKYGPFGVFLAVWCILDLKEIFLQNSLFLC